MKLSEAIRLGAMMGPQIHGSLLNLKTNGTCAIGAALLAVGKGGDAFAIYTLFPSLILENDGVSPLSRILFLNDSCRRTREEIADYIVAKGWDCEALLDAEVPVMPRLQEEPCPVSALAP